MDFLSDPQFWGKWISIVLLDIVLAGDNALVIALAVHSLPAKQQFWGRVYGTLGAVVLRLLFIALVTWLLAIPLLRLIGGLALVWIAYKLVAHAPGEEENVRQGASLREAIGIIILADVVMSFDNVMAISGAAHGDMVLVIFGLLLSLPLIIWLGGGVLGWVALRMMLDDPWVARVAGNPITNTLHQSLPWIAAIGFTALGWWQARARVASSAP